MLTSLAALLLTVGALTWYDRATFRDEVLRDVDTLAGILGENASSSVAFNDQRQAQATLAALRAQPQITGAAIYDSKGALFATYVRAKNGDKPGAAAAGWNVDRRAAHRRRAAGALQRRARRHAHGSIRSERDGRPPRADAADRRRHLRRRGVRRAAARVACFSARFPVRFIACFARRNASRARRTTRCASRRKRTTRSACSSTASTKCSARSARAMPRSWPNTIRRWRWRARSRPPFCRARSSCPATTSPRSCCRPRRSAAIFTSSGGRTAARGSASATSPATA